MDGEHVPLSLIAKQNYDLVTSLVICEAALGPEGFKFMMLDGQSGVILK